MRKFVFALALLFCLSTPALAQTETTDASCDTPTEATTDYAQVGDDIVMVECGADGNVCRCHGPAENGTCTTYVCNPDGTVKEPPPKPNPKAVEKKKEEPTSAPAETPKKKSKSRHKKDAAKTEKPVEAPATDVAPGNKADAQTGAPSEGKIEYSRRH